MKRMMCLLLTAVMMVLIAGCSTVSLDKDAVGTITYSYGGVSFSEELTDKEAAAAVRILNGKSQIADALSCGFTADISITLDGVTFALACDSCGAVKNCETGKTIRISDEERTILEALFTVRGGVFPCV